MTGDLTRTLEGLVPPEDEQRVFAVLEHALEERCAACDARVTGMEATVRELARIIAQVLPRMQELATRALPIAEPNRRTIIREVATIHPRMCEAYFRELDARGLRTKWGETYMEASRVKDKCKRISHEKNYYKNCYTKT
jgi:hypothetical protein